MLKFRYGVASYDKTPYLYNIIIKQKIMNATFLNTYCIGVIVNGTSGDVKVTKMNKKSFSYEGWVNLLTTENKVFVSGDAKFWKVSKDGSKAYYKSGSAVLTLNNN